VDALAPLADELGISLAQLALAWCLRRPSLASVIVGATSGEQLEENAKASGMRVPAEIEARIDEIAPAPES
jgi:aryl-alcohol dehydrogenase-like predicted oxidoreductase